MAAKTRKPKPRSKSRAVKKSPRKRGSTNTAAAAGVQQLRFARQCTKELLKDIRDDQFCAVPEAGGKNAMWVVAHLAMTDVFFLRELKPGAVKKSLPESWNKLFGSGSKPTSDVSQYPSASEVKKALDEYHAPLVKCFAGMTPKELSKQMPKGWEQYAPTVADVASFAAWHEGYHAGQLTEVRRALGLGPAFG